MGALQPMHLILILLIALIVVGPGKLSNLGGALGKTVRDFRTSMKEEENPEEGEKAPEKKPEA